MIVETIAQYIADNTDYSLGEDIWLHNLPSDVEEGIAIKFIRSMYSFDKAKVTRISIFPLYKTWSKHKDATSAIQSLLSDHYGLVNVDWAVSGEIEVSFFGLDDHNRYVGSITLNIKE